MEEIPVIMDFCLRIQRSAVQASGKALASMLMQERARWLNLNNLFDKAKDEVLDRWNVTSLVGKYPEL